jgi:hypothetical protein
MPIRLDRTPDFFLLTVTGVLTEADLTRAAVLAAEAEDASEIAPNRLIDLTRIESIAVGFPEMMVVAAQRRSRVLANDVKSAFVVASEVQKGYARMFQTLLDHPRIRLEIFHDRAAAEAWLRVPL